MNQGPIEVNDLFSEEWLRKVERLTIILEELEKVQNELREEGILIEIDVIIKEIRGITQYGRDQ